MSILPPKCMLAVCLALLLIGCAETENEAERYESECHRRGGFLSTHVQWSYVDFDCVGESPNLPRLRR